MSTDRKLELISPVEIDVDLETFFDMSLTALRLGNRKDKPSGVELKILKKQPKALSADLKRVVVGGALFEEGQADEFWAELEKIQEKQKLGDLAE